MRVNSSIYVFKFNLYRILRRVHRVNLRTVLRTDHACGPDSRAAHLYATTVVLVFIHDAQFVHVHRMSECRNSYIPRY